jgi:hypothetical protein
VRATNFEKMSARKSQEIIDFSTKDEGVCNRLLRSLQNRQGRIEIINKIFRKERGESHVYRFAENILKNKIKNLAKKGIIKSKPPKITFRRG